MENKDKSQLDALRFKDLKKFLNKKLHFLNDFIADLDGLLTEMEVEFFRVAIFGSARIESQSIIYQHVHDLAQGLASRGVDIVTGGGPGLMEAANKGAMASRKGSRSIGLAIQLPFELDANAHLDVKRQHRRFSSRLDEFMRISHAVVVTHGGIGTLLELFYAWQLLQVKHMKPRPLILLGKNYWQGLLDWMKDQVVGLKMMDAEDLAMITLVDSVEEVIAVLDPKIKVFNQNKLANKKTQT